ncbi:MAG TPA: hypothetical protein VM511_09660 [Luteolibacter sp.]|nr:hypothetical protein [Luteolibacter sp.]
MPSQAPPTLPSDPAWQGKRKFWGWNIAVSAIVMILVPGGLFLYGMIGMQGAFGTLGTKGADVDALSNHISEVLVATSLASVFGLIAFVWMIASIVRFCMISKPLAVIEPQPSPKSGTGQPLDPPLRS